MCVDVDVAMSASVRCNRTDRRTDREAAGWRQWPHACHDTPHAEEPHTAAPTLHTHNERSVPASRTSGNSNVKYSHRDKRQRDKRGEGETWEVSTDEGVKKLIKEATLQI